MAVASCLGIAALAPTLDRPATSQAIVSPELRAETTRVFHALAQLRGLPPGGTAPRVVMRSREERRRFIVGELARKYTPTRLDAERHALVAWGLIPPDFDLPGFLTDLVVEQAAAYYDPIAKIMVLANWLGPDAQREALTHELVHALQDRQMDLDRFLGGTPGRSDEALARQALVEGEAVGLTFDLGLHRQGRDLGVLPDVLSLQRAIVTSATGPMLSRAPRFLRASLTFPYAQGVGFVHAFRRRQPWTALSALYRDPPASTAQIIHPERYLDRREDPLVLALPDLGPAFGPGARRILEDDLGEFGLAQVLAQFLGEGAPLGHWRGDRYALWEGADGARGLVALTTWDDADSASAFAAAYLRLLARKHGLPPPTADDPLAAWTVGHHAFAVDLRGRDVLLIEGAPGASLDRIRERIWASRPAAGSRDGPHTGAILDRRLCPASRPGGSSGSPTPMAIGTTRSTMSCPSSPVSAH